MICGIIRKKKNVGVPMFGLPDDNEFFFSFLWKNKVTNLQVGSASCIKCMYVWVGLNYRIGNSFTTVDQMGSIMESFYS